MNTFLLVSLFFIICFSAMSIGVIINNKPIKGSCGGPKVIGPDGENLSCFACPNRNKKNKQKCIEEK